MIVFSLFCAVFIWTLLLSVITSGNKKPDPIAAPPVAAHDGLLLLVDHDLRMSSVLVPRCGLCSDPRHTGDEGKFSVAVRRACWINATSFELGAELGDSVALREYCRPPNHGDIVASVANGVHLIG